MWWQHQPEGCALNRRGKQLTQALSSKPRGPQVGSKLSASKGPGVERSQHLGPGGPEAGDSTLPELRALELSAVVTPEPISAPEQF